jgi:hypothetical protein
VNAGENFVPSTAVSLPKFSTCGGRPTMKNRSLTPSPMPSIVRSRSSIGSGGTEKIGARGSPMPDTTGACACAGAGGA